MTELVNAADILITTEEDTERVFGIKAASCEKVARILAKQFHLETAATTLREIPVED